jgi:probable addiction module antidote protein
MKKLRKFKSTVIEKLQDQEYARTYLEVALEEYSKDHNTRAFFLALKDVAEAQGGLSHLAQQTNLNRSNLYGILSGQNKPKLDTVDTILNGLGFKLQVVPKGFENNESPTFL